MAAKSIVAPEVAVGIGLERLRPVNDFIILFLVQQKQHLQNENGNISVPLVFAVNRHFVEEFAKPLFLKKPTNRHGWVYSQKLDSQNWM